MTLSAVFATISLDMNPDRATAMLAVIRIISVLGMAFGISLGIFLLLGAWWIPGLIALVAAVPFFSLMRYMEKRAMASDDAPHTG